MNLEFQNKREELDKKRKFFEDQQNMNSKLEKEVEILDQNISDLSIRLNREEQARTQYIDEVIIFLLFFLKFYNLIKKFK
jgi:hypothetical protein